jgi:hypothetical protein
MGVFSATVGFEYLRTHAYLFGTVSEFFFVGFLGIVFSFISKDKPASFGLTKKRVFASIGLGIAFIGLQSLIYWLLGIAVIDYKLDAFSGSLAQPFPLNVFYSAFTAFSYGPLQVFFLIFIADRLNKGLSNSGFGLSYKAIAITIIIWVLPHALNIPILGIVAASVQLVKMCIQGLVIFLAFKYTGNSVGSMIYWTFIELFQT